MKLKTLIGNLQKFDSNLDVELWIDESEGYNNIGYNIYVDLDGNGKEKTLEIHIGEHNKTKNPTQTITNAKKLISDEITNFDVNDFLV